MRILLNAMLIGACASASSGQVDLVFSEPDFEWLASGDFATPYAIWRVGDRWSQTFPDTGLPEATSMELQLELDPAIAALEPLDLEVLLNGAVGGGFTLMPDDSGVLQYDFAFAAIAGDGYDLVITATSQISDGNGSYGILLANGLSKATLIPGAPTAAGLALCALGMVRRARR